MVATKPAAPAIYKTPLRLIASTCAAMMGDTMPKIRPQKLASPHAVPRIGAGKTSGVHPYRIALNMLWKKYSMRFNPMFDASVLTAANRKRETPIRADEITIPHLRPISGTAYLVGYQSNDRSKWREVNRT